MIGDNQRIVMAYFAGLDRKRSRSFRLMENKRL